MFIVITRICLVWWLFDGVLGGLGLFDLVGGFVLLVWLFVVFDFAFWLVCCFCLIC